MEPQIRFCTSADGTRLAYATAGEGPALVHPGGWAGVEGEWTHPEGLPRIEDFSKGRLFAEYDLRGVGASQREVSDFSLEAHIADLAAVVDHLQLDRFDLFGPPTAAFVCVAYAALKPERVSRLVLFGACRSGRETASEEAIEGLVELIGGNWSLARRAIAEVLYPTGPMELQRWLATSLRRSMSPQATVEYLRLQLNVDVTPYLPRVRAPTLVLHRRGDHNVPMEASRALAAAIPDARFVVLEGDVDDWVYGYQQYLQVMMEFLNEGRPRETAHEPPQPGAFRTILFTDVEGSTALTQRLGDERARAVLREHERIVREALKSHGGSEIKAMGDGFMASFSSTRRALECAIAMQRAFAKRNESAEEPIKVRVGLNAGEPIAEDEDLFGTAVNEAARITAAAKGGEILVANVVRELAKGKDFEFADGGEFLAKGFEEAVRVYEVRWRKET